MSEGKEKIIELKVPSEVIILCAVKDGHLWVQVDTEKDTGRLVLELGGAR